MDKLKKVFSPGHSKDDEVLYGDNKTGTHGSTTHSTTQQDSTSSGTVGAADNNDNNNNNNNNTGGVIDQITNPDGNKYDEQRFDASRTAGNTPSTASTVPVTGGNVDPNARMYTEPDAKKEHGILRQILNPGGDKRDDVAYGSNAAVVGQQQPPHGIHDGQSGTTGVAGAGSAQGSALPIASTMGNTSTLPDPSVPAGPSGNHDREAAVLGSGAALGTGAGVGAAQYEQPHANVLDRSHPLRDGTGAGADHINPVGSGTSGIGQQPNVVSTYGTSGGERGVDSFVNPVGAPSTTNMPGAGSEREAAIIGGAGGVGGAGLAGGSAAPVSSGLNSRNDDSHSLHNTGIVGAAGLAGAGAGTAAHSHSHDQSGFGGSGIGGSASGAQAPHPGYIHYTSGPHPSDIANQLDPAVAAGPPLSPIGGHAQLSHGATTGHDSHLGRDAAVIGGAGAVGAGAYGATRDHSTAVPHNGGVVNTSSTGATQAQQPYGSQTTHDSHLGRDAALVGGAGALGAGGAYAATRDHNTAGTHGIANTSSTHTPATYGGAHSEIDGRHAPGVAGGHTTYGGTHPEIDSKHAPAAASHTTYGGTHPEIDHKHQGAAVGAAGTGAAGGAAAVYSGHDGLRDDKHDRKLEKAREEEAKHGGDHGEEKKPSLIHRILHPGGKEEKHHDSHDSHDKHDKHDKHDEHDKHEKHGALATHDKHDTHDGKQQLYREDLEHTPGLGDRHHHQHLDSHGNPVHDSSAGPNEGIPRSSLTSEVGREQHGHPKTTVDEKGHTKLHKEPPANHPAAQGNTAGVAGPDWEAVNRSNATSGI